MIREDFRLENFDIDTKQVFFFSVPEYLAKTHVALVDNPKVFGLPRYVYAWRAVLCI